tara:strand:- start:287 stop:598 length:312 start_codon:yes stop_codon:yes gene_type:complete
MVNYVFMIIEIKDNRLFLIKCSDWSVAVDSTDHDEASTKALSYMMEEYGDNLKLSCVMISIDVSDLPEDPEKDDNILFHSTSKILANAGYHNMSKTMKKIFDT